ncbi:hypothetical protein HQQ94_13205 [Shewanella sp. VB17]|uniref:hypothetical protein n=1 Tax=Shewanella sp. VB17 TaxID=2739432 RepID=UPI0015665546|nr:hypothetical protein [Shewanella sp. VB17]NRD74177.1 hypothetical protein [Shewanella sp. VB17]
MKQYETKFSLSIMSAALVAALSFSSAAMAADSDGDGLDDSIERMYGWNPYDANSPGESDYDGDGLTDLTEYKAFTNIYDPNNPVDMGDTDDDGDTLPKGLEVFLMGTDPDKADTDCDGDNDNVDSNPVDGSCAPDPGADMTDDITIDDEFADNQIFSIGVPVDMVYTVEYTDSPSISTSTIDDDSTYMTWEVSALGNNNLAYVELDNTTGRLTFNEGVDEDDRFTVKASVNEYPEVFDEIIVVAGAGIPNGDSVITIGGDSSDSQSFAKGVDIPLNYTVDYTYGDPISTDGNNDSATMVWSVPSEDNLTLNKDTGILVFGDNFPAETSVVVTATLKENLEITDTIEVFAEDQVLGQGICSAEANIKSIRVKAGATPPWGAGDGATYVNCAGTISASKFGGNANYYNNKFSLAYVTDGFGNGSINDPYGKNSITLTSDQINHLTSVTSSAVGDPTSDSCANGPILGQNVKTSISGYIKYNTTTKVLTCYETQSATYCDGAGGQSSSSSSSRTCEITYN